MFCREEHCRIKSLLKNNKRFCSNYVQCATLDDRGKVLLELCATRYCTLDDCGRYHVYRRLVHLLRSIFTTGRSTSSRFSPLLRSRSSEA